MKTIQECREAHKKVMKVSNGMVAWITKSNTYNDYGVRFYQVNSEYKAGDFEKVDGDILQLIETL